ncbi:hypothetical protein [Mesorhizobium abyssinicae]|uniref:hypothetical protein n=1 Tax=Mesorhizobium abyssinicae TaxID=1209958 RepID=UPI003482F471
MLRSRKHSARKLKRAQILLAADAGLGDETIATSSGGHSSRLYSEVEKSILADLSLAQVHGHQSCNLADTRKKRPVCP